MNNAIKEIWQTAVVAAGNEKSFSTTCGDVRDKFAKLMIERCASVVYSVAPSGDIADYLQYEVLKLGEPDES